jgi:hypothetical protein
MKKTVGFAICPFLILLKVNYLKGKLHEIWLLGTTSDSKKMLES